MRILVSNDDGIDAPGIARLAEAARRLSDDVWVVAPEKKHTAAGPSLTIAQPITMEKRGDRRFSCSGRPADCVVAAFAWLFENDRKPDLVLAGINDGRNVAEDLAYSGTLGIAREATFWGVPAIGFSRVKNPEITDADEAWLSGFIGRLWENRAQWAQQGHWLSVNLPTLLPAEVRQPVIGRDKIASKAEVVESDGDRTIIIVPRGRPHTSVQGDENSMIDAGFVTVNRLNWFGGARLEDGFVAGF
ncbi:5'/3'-nucleotidase SurE [Aquamicrobium ahrensii]|uniref:5'-nucleotidase n=1 Tax=Aquamicrobium ahrensii TaxID=469551 RepID=A0ABV2KJV1_9HYPH